ncbi:zinc finger and BTB domain-containing protein 43 [Hyla sarda]|uniref:zinc finger and BTB domain-containing protein 43 n=1 Tax=Hyla sarda TaxID=327740 RepID=UPI0024C45B17|nr:zinc finger and BTB domain-containing protein 43 [Hyla sarda]XP_056397010.1 zinc finger and BTB domain-containing protein 43 [Hyla sarda]
MEPGINLFRVEFPDFSNTILQKLNQQRQLGQLCDISIVVQGHLFRAHKAVLAASSPYFCDQVLLKNSRRVVLPDVMNPRVFENILLSSYTGRLALPPHEIVSYLTAASFLQMWHVVDKCTELLEGNPTLLCQKSSLSNDHQSPSSSNYNGLGESFELGTCAQSEFRKGEEIRGGENEEDSPKDDELSSQLTEHEYLPSNSSTEHDQLSTEMTSQDGEEGASDSADYHYSRPLYIKPSIMSHKRWVHVKPERFDQECEGVEMNPPFEDHVSESINLAQTDPPIQSSGVVDSFDFCNKKSVEPEGHGSSSNNNNRYDDHVDFYGASMEEFTGEREEHLEGHGTENTSEGFGEGLDISTGIKEETSSSGFTAVVYKLYPCQCGKSFTHKSQRDRHMSMHLGLRPYGCGVCGKKFKMKHHLVGHMKIHTGIKPYECNICGKRFMWRDSFHRHVTSCTKSYHASKGEPAQAES